MRPTADEISSILGLQPHPTCGMTTVSYASPHRIANAALPPGYRGTHTLASALYFLVMPERQMKLHRLRSDQIYHHYLGDPLEVDARIEFPEPVDLAGVRRDVAGWLGIPSDAGDFAPRADWGGERSLAARATFAQSSPTEVTVHATWERAELERAARSLAAWLEPRLRALGQSAH